MPLSRLWRPLLEDAMLRETAFVRPDCREMLDGSLLFVQDFLTFRGWCKCPPAPG